tara:strand:+ start:196 stop:522 length:327 start_codon:yes stop_codon:yes gene_type:complete
MAEEYNNVKEFARNYRKEILPILKSNGFKASVTTNKGSYYSDGAIVVTIKSVPSNFDVYDPENSYVRHHTENAKNLEKAITERIRTLAVKADLDIDVQMYFDRRIPRN